jgi:hypothetical protein
MLEEIICFNDLIDHHLSSKGKMMFLHVIGLFVPTCFDVRAFPNTLPPPKSTSDKFFHPALTRLFSADFQYLTSLRTPLCHVSPASSKYPLGRERTAKVHKSPQNRESGSIVDQRFFVRAISCCPF